MSIRSIAEVLQRHLKRAEATKPPVSGVTRGTFNLRLCARCNQPFTHVRYFARRKSRPYCNDCHAAYMREWRKGNPLSPEAKRKDNCRSYAGQYLKRGKIKREPCKACGSPESQMHHPDYAKPLLVEWMCRPCHLREHYGHDEINRSQC